MIFEFFFIFYDYQFCNKMSPPKNFTTLPNWYNGVLLYHATISIIWKYMYYVLFICGFR